MVYSCYFGKRLNGGVVLNVFPQCGHSLAQGVQYMYYSF